MFENIIKIIEILLLPVFVVIIKYLFDKRIIKLEEKVDKIAKRYEDEDNIDTLLKHIEDLRYIIINVDSEYSSELCHFIQIIEDFYNLANRLINTDISSMTCIPAIKQVEACIDKTIEYCNAYELKTELKGKIETFNKDYKDILLEEIKMIYNDAYNNKKQRIINSIKMFLLKFIENVIN